MANDNKLWKVFSEFIRLRDADENGMAYCFTCGLLRHWKKGDCGHGIGRQHKSTKYNEKNNQFQCKKCNGFEGGMRERFKENMDRRYGNGTWDLMELMAKKPVKWGQFEIDAMTAHYKQLVSELKKAKNIAA
jgi:hypothetical protein